MCMCAVDRNRERENIRKVTMNTNKTEVKISLCVVNLAVMKPILGCRQRIGELIIAAASHD